MSCNRSTVKGNRYKIYIYIYIYIYKENIKMKGYKDCLELLAC